MTNLFTIKAENEQAAVELGLEILAEATGHVSVSDRQTIRDLINVCIHETFDSMPSTISDNDPERQAWDALGELGLMADSGQVCRSYVKNSWEFKRATLLTIVRQEVCAKYS